MYRALTRMVKAGNTVEYTCFPGTVGSDNRSNNPGLDGDVDIGKSVQPAKGKGHVRNNELRHKELDHFVTDRLIIKNWSAGTPEVASEDIRKHNFPGQKQCLKE